MKTNDLTLLIILKMCKTLLKFDSLSRWGGGGGVKDFKYLMIVISDRYLFIPSS